MGGGIPATYEDVDMSECADLLTTEDKTLAFTAANSMGFITSCTAKNTWVGQHYSLWNIANMACTLGLDERCKLDMAVSNQPSCPHQLGLQTPLTLANPVDDIAYGTGAFVKAVQ